MDFYRDIILDHYRNPRNFGEMENPDVTITEGNRSCGDVIRMDVTFTDDKEKMSIKEIKFSGQGCAICIASSSMLTESVQTMNTDEILKFDRNYIQDLIGVTLTPTRLKCALLPLQVLKTALKK